MTNLPNGFTVRAASLDDATAVTEMLIACDMADYGEPDTSVEDVLAYWRRDGFVIERDTWLVYAPDGNLAACGMVLDNGLRARIDPSTNIHPRYRGIGLELYQVEQVEEWARQHIESKTVQWVVNTSQTENVALLEGRGYDVVRHDYVMEIEMHAPPPEPMLDNGLVMRSFELGRDEHPVHAAIQEAFHDVWGHHTDLSFEAWWSGYGEHKDWSPELSCIVTDGDEIAGAAMAFNFDNGGWIRQLGVRRPWRRRGIGLAILYKIFGEFYARGVKKVGLGVDAASLTGATRLYERAGMRVKNQYARFEKELA